MCRPVECFDVGSNPAVDGRQVTPSELEILCESLGVQGGCTWNEQYELCWPEGNVDVPCSMYFEEESCPESCHWDPEMYFCENATFTECPNYMQAECPSPACQWITFDSASEAVAMECSHMLCG